jgi:pentachlorophenol monooxygenase
MFVTPLLVVGAGPAGLMLAAELSRAGVQFTICDSNLRPSRATKASGIHPNTLRLFERLGLASKLLAQAHQLEGMYAYVDKQQVYKVAFQNDCDPLNRNYAVPQSITESILLEYLAANGVIVLRDVKITSCRKTDEGILTRVRKNGKPSTIRAGFVVGADGSHSSVRKSCKISFRGFRDERTSFAVDARLSEPVLNLNWTHQFYTRDDRLVCVPLSVDGLVRVTGYLPQATNYSQSPGAVLRAIKKHITRWLDCDVAIIGRSLSTYRLTSIIAKTFTRGHSALIGDAAHTFLPLGGYGLNAAFDDASKLARLWGDDKILRLPMESDLKAWGHDRRVAAMNVRKDIAIRKSKLTYRAMLKELERRGTSQISESRFRQSS